MGLLSLMPGSDKSFDCTKRVTTMSALVDISAHSCDVRFTPKSGHRGGHIGTSLSSAGFQVYGWQINAQSFSLTRTDAGKRATKTELGCAGFCGLSMCSRHAGSGTRNVPLPGLR